MEYRQFSLDDADLWPELIQCYQEVFAARPWGEWQVCAVCAEQWGIEQAAELVALGYRHCGQEVVPRWPEEVIRDDFCQDLAFPGSSCWLALDVGRVVGFCNGYPLSVDNFDAYVGVPGVTATILSTFGPTSHIAYQDDMGVRAEYRGRNIGSELFRRRQADFIEQGLTIGAMRTMCHPPTVTYQWYTRVGYQTMARFGGDMLVVLARSLADL